MVTRYAILTVLTASLPLILGFWSEPRLLVFTIVILDHLFGITISSVGTKTICKFSALIGSLLAICAPTAIVMLGIFSRKRSGWPRVYGFFLFLLLAMADAAIGIELGLLFIKNHLKSSDNISVWYALGYPLWWAFGASLGGYGFISIILFLISLRRKKICDV
jgi:hypothetical protein